MSPFALPNNPMRRDLIGAWALLSTGVSALPLRPVRRRAHVAVVGAGMAGLNLAWALEQRGLTVTVLEAQNRLGGRNWTLRSGDVLPDVLGTPQVCTFSVNQCLNAGPWRIAPQHHRMLALAQRLSIPLEPVQASPGSLALRPVGGMDVLPLRLSQTLRTAVQLESPVRIVRCNEQRGVALGYGAEAHLQWLEADYAVFTVPLALLNTLQWHGEVQELVRSSTAAMRTADAIKVAWQLSEPPTRWPKPQPGAPHWWLHWPHIRSTPPERVAHLYANDHALTAMFAGIRSEQLASVRAQMEQALLSQNTGLVPVLSDGLVVQWSRLPYQRSAACKVSTTLAKRLRLGIGPVLFAGDALSPDNGWQEGALQSAQWTAQVVQKIADDSRLSRDASIFGRSL